MGVVDVVRMRLVDGVRMIVRMAVPGVMVVTVVVAVIRGRGASTSPDLAKEHPAADDDDRDRGHEWGASDDDVRGDDIGRGEHHGGQHQDPDRMRNAYRGPQTDRMTRRAARPDEVRGHQRLAVTGGQGMARAESGRGDEG